MWRCFSRCMPVLALVLCHVGLVGAAEPVVLRYKLVKGATLITRSTLENKTTQMIAGQKLESEIVQTSVDSRVIESLEADDTAKVTTKTVRLKTNLKIPVLGDYEFDSQKADRDKSSQIGAALTPLYERLVGSELKLDVNHRGVVKNLTGYQQLVGDIIKENPLAGQFAAGGSDNAAKLSAQGAWLVFPENAVKPGDKWDNPFEMELGGLGLVKGKETVTFTSLEIKDGKTIAKFSVSSDIAFDLNLDMNGAKVTGKITTANSMGSAEFDVSAGRLVKQNGEITLSGDLSVVAGGQTIPVPMTQTVKTGLELLDKLPE